MGTLMRDPTRLIKGDAGPAVSVVMPVYNAQRFLAQSIESILHQTFADFEFIIVNDGSSDDSLAIARRYELQDSRIRILSRTNTGIVGALNDGLAIARGPLIARMDADDIALPDRFERQVAHMERHPECVLLGTRVLLTDEELSPICQWALETEHEQIDRAHLERRWPMVHPTVMMRCDAVMAVGAYRQQYATQEDVDMFLRLAERGRIANLPQVLLLYRQHFDSICSTRSREQGEVREQLFAEAYRRRGLKPRASPTAEARPSKRAFKHLWWAWKALEAGHIATARKHAIRVMRRQPLDIESWRLMYCALRGR